MAKKKIQNTYLNGSTMRSHNKAIHLYKDKDKEHFNILFRFADENPDTPACQHTCLKGKVRQTYLKLSEEAMEDLVRCYTEFKKLQLSQAML
jgi:hypothetical protein